MEESYRAFIEREAAKTNDKDLFIDGAEYALMLVDDFLFTHVIGDEKKCLLLDLFEDEFEVHDNYKPNPNKKCDMKEIFYTSRCTGQSFTREEWWKYLDEHKNDTDEAVHYSDKFGYNIHDVCLNPNTFYSYNRGDWSFKVTTNMIDSGKWTYGIEVNLHNRSWLSGGGYRDDDECFVSESDAAKKGLEDIMNYIDNVIESDNTVSHIPSQIKSMKDDIESKLAKLKMKQLELFTV